MGTLQSTIFIEFDVNTKKIIFLRGDNIIDCDSNATSIYVRVKYKNLSGNTIYLTPSELEHYKFSLYTIKPATNNINIIIGEVTDELKENVYGGVVKFEIPRACTNRLGIVKCEIHINQGNKIIGSSTFVLDVKQSLVTAFDDELLGDEDFPVLKQLILEIQKDSNIDDNNRSKITTYSSDKIEDIKRGLNLEIKDKVNRGEGGVITNAMLSQEVKESMTGGSVPVVGKDSILEENIVDRQVTRNKVADGVMDIYPFQPRAKFRHNKQTSPDCDYESEIRGLIKDIKLYNADKTKQYYIQAINRNVNGNYYIAIYDSDNIKVCEFNTNDYTESELDSVNLYSINNSGIHGIAIVDWSKFKQNTGIYGMDYEETGLQIGVIADNDGANLKPYSVSRSQLADDALMSYPFQIRANFKHNGTDYKAEIKPSIKDIHLYGAKANKKYAISSLWRSVGSERKYLIGIVEVLDDGSTVIVCEKEEWYYQEPTGIDEFKLTERNGSGIEAVVYIDWSEIPLGDGYYGMKYDETGIDVRCCKDKISSTDVPGIEIPTIILPSKIYATVGHELNIYYESVVDCDDVFNYKVDVEYDGPDAKQLEECFRVNPTTAGNYTFTLKLYKYGDLVASKTCTISVVEDKTLGDLRGLYIGDSITEQNWYLYELQNMIPTFKSVGTRGDWGGLNHEGRSSWATTHYLSSTSYAGKTNAFYNPSTNTFDFNYYMSNSSIEIPSFVTLALGTNDAGNINADTLVANFNTMINSIRSYNPNMKIGITIAPPPARNQDGWGRNNGVGATSYTHKKAIFEFAKKIIETFDNREDEGIYILPIYVNIDPVLDFPYEEVAASSRNTTIIKRGTDNVHPHKEGMYKISDIHYNWIKAIF